MMGALPAFTFITDNLAIGGLMAYAQPYELAQFHTILSVAAEFGDEPQKIASPVYPYTRDVFTVGMRDAEVEPRRLAAALLYVESTLRAHELLLITCAEGRNRSALVVAAWLILAESKDPDTVLALIRDKRPGALANPHFSEWLWALRDPDTLAVWRAWFWPSADRGPLAKPSPGVPVPP